MYAAYRSIGHLALALCIVFALPKNAKAAYAALTLRHEHFLFTIDPDYHPEWRKTGETWTYRGEEIRPPAELRVDGDIVPALPEGMEKRQSVIWNTEAIRMTIVHDVSRLFDRPAGAVTINRNGSGAITFDGVGLTGRRVDPDAAADAVVQALDRGITDIFLPVAILQPSVTVTDPELTAMGITEVVTVGESDFSNSPVNRRHNIATGLSKFNGHLIPKDTSFSFGETLGPVNGTTGYRKELVIKGDRTEPDYGGGLCQVSTTAYRGAWEYGFPIEARINHSYAVGHYGPQGTDATVYPPHPDMKFKNDSPGALLMQTYTQDNHAYFIYYGTKDGRTAQVIGPYIWGRTMPPPDKIEYTTALPPRQKKKLGERIPGMQTAWFRILVDAQGQEKVVPVYSIYQSRPLFYQVGVEALPTPPAVDINTPEPPYVF